MTEVVSDVAERLVDVGRAFAIVVVKPGFSKTVTVVVARLKVFTAQLYSFIFTFHKEIYTIKAVHAGGHVWK